jgi:transposase
LHALHPDSLLCRASSGIIEHATENALGSARYLEAFLRFCPKARQLRRLALQFRAMLRWRNAKRLSTWIDTAIASPFRFLAQFANTLRRDIAAVELSITKPWSNGPIEGHINRLKMIKRQMYGRARFELLKARVLPREIALTS